MTPQSELSAARDADSKKFWRSLVHSKTSPTPLGRFGGWLSFFQAQVVVSLCAFVFGFGAGFGSLVAVLLVSPYLAGLILIVRRHPSTRLYWLILLYVSVPIAMWLETAAGFEPVQRNATLWWSVVWIFYWHRSYRVWKTFRQGKGATSESPPVN